MADLERTRHLLSMLDAFQGTPILLVGDLMLDRYIWGDVSRISPEAPVPVLRVTDEDMRLGGAGSVIANLRVLGAEVRAVSAFGSDVQGDRLADLLQREGVDTTGIIREPGLATTQKTRLIARTQHVLRLDRDGETIPPETLERLTRKALDALDGVAAVLVSDYDRGVLSTGSLCQTLAKEARARGIPVIADPHREAPFERYQGVSCLTPNRAETARAIGINPTDEASILLAAQTLIERYDLEWTLVTLDKDGIYLLRRGEQRGQRFPAKARAVFDVAGAGDMVLAVLGLAVGTQPKVEAATLEDAVILANLAGGLEVERLGVSPVTPEELRAEIQTQAPPLLRRKIVNVEQALARIEQARRAGQTIVWTNGCFDLLHAGHVHFLQGCRAQGDFLVVGLNTDSSIKGLKGPDRPVLGLDERGTVLAGLEAVDLVVPFDEPTPMKAIERLHPDVLCKGEDYKDKVVVGRELVESYGGRVALVELWPGVSTTHLIERISNANAPKD